MSQPSTKVETETYIKQLRKAFIEATGEYPEDLFGEDWEFYLLESADN